MRKVFYQEEVVGVKVQWWKEYDIFEELKGGQYVWSLENKWVVVWDEVGEVDKFRVFEVLWIIYVRLCGVINVF